MVSAEIQSLCWVFFLPRHSSHVSCQIFLLCSQCVLMSVSGSIRSCSSWYLLERLMLNAACVSLFLSSPTWYFVRVFLMLVTLFSRNLNAVGRGWWSDDTSAPLITRTSLHDLLNLWLMQMRSIWSSVTWSVDLHVDLWMRLCGKMLPPITPPNLPPLSGGRTGSRQLVSKWNEVTQNQSNSLITKKKK